MINGSELVNQSVAGKKLEAYTVTGAQVKVSTFPMVPSAKQATNATNANYATNAGSAVTAGNVDGHTLFAINASAGPEAAATLIDDVNGLTLSVDCAPGSGGGTLNLVATTNVDDSSFGLAIVDGSGSTDSEFEDLPGNFETGVTYKFGFANAGEVTFSYNAPSTGVVSGTFTTYDEDGCAAFGNADSFSV
jgi:hypothetical protein